MTKFNKRRHPDERRIRRSQERGSVLFIVLMGMLLLTSLGTWVVYASGLASSAAGYQRSASQALYLSELAVLSGTGYLAQPGMAGTAYALEERKRIEGNADSCTSVPNLNPTDKCKAIGLPEINTAVIAGNPSGYSLLDVTAGGSFSPYAASQDGEFRIEFSGFRSAAVMGTDQAAGLKDRYQQATIAAYATLHPSSPAVCAGSAGANAAATLVGMRAYSVIGPMTQ